MKNVLYSLRLQLFYDAICDCNLLAHAIVMCWGASCAHISPNRPTCNAVLRVLSQPFRSPLISLPCRHLRLDYRRQIVGLLLNVHKPRVTMDKGYSSVLRKHSILVYKVSCYSVQCGQYSPEMFWQYFIYS